MLDQGYSLSEVELLNWGNFHQYQKFQLHEQGISGPLFSPPAASAILGVNGSGKSTLIDGIMMVLLPFENSLKLGMTNDSEAGSAGGRTIHDYVLGKFSSSGENVNGQLKSVYGREQGCSMFLLHFTHNKSPAKKLTLGRIWWYSGHNVNDAQISFLDQGYISLPDLCPDGIPPKSPKAFREHLRSKFPAVQIFETMQAYFNALSSSLGKISRDDLKILNRAFYVKSISQIDQFIRENMLLEHDNPHLDRLLENVKNGQEIARAIETCEEKIAAIESILKFFDKLLVLKESQKELDTRRRLLTIFQDWSEWKRTAQQVDELDVEIKNDTIQIPLLKQEIESLKNQIQFLRSEIENQDIESELATLDLRKKMMEDKIQWLSKVEAQALEISKQIGLRLPQNSANWAAHLVKLDQLLEKQANDILKHQGDLENLRQQNYNVDVEAQTLKAELEHLSQNRTMISRELYAIKEAAMEDLGIPQEELSFVGELIQIAPDSRPNRIAIESVLFPISRNLLCHPEHLTALTKWLDGKGLRSDITVKRISKDELNCEEVPMDFAEDEILGMIEVLSQEKNPFCNYLWKWLTEVFDYRLVSLAEFHRSRGKLVTAEGLAKTDDRTMRKLKKQFSHSLGWNNEEHIAELTQKLVELNKKYHSYQLKIKDLVAAVKLLELQSHQLEELKKMDPEFLNLEDQRKNALLIENQKKELLKKNPDYQKKRQELEIAEIKMQDFLKQLGLSESQLKKNQKRVEQLLGLLPQMERNLKESLIFGQLLSDFTKEELVIEALEKLELVFRKQETSRVQLEGEVDKKIKELEVKRGHLIAAASTHMNNYKRNHSDPNLAYELRLDDHFHEIQEGWISAFEKLKKTELPAVRTKWKNFFDQILFDSVKDTINEIKSRLHEIQRSIESINEVLKLTNFEDLVTEKRYLKIDFQSSVDDRVRKFRKLMSNAEKILGTTTRSMNEAQTETVMNTLSEFVADLQKDPHYRNFVTDVRNHFQFRVHSFRRAAEGGASDADELAEIFTGARKDAKSSAQTTQLAYTLLASCLAYRFKFHDPVLGQDTPRLIILDEFGGKFDNEKPKDIMKLLAQMGFQAVYVSPMSKADLLAHGIGQLVNVFKVSASESKVKSEALSSKDDYDRMIHEALRQAT